MQAIKDCEGGIPETFWCSHCLIRAVRCEELLTRFEKMNLLKKKTSWKNSTTYYPHYYGGDSTTPPEYEN